ncbi:MAG: nuclear transport factor 2 family protein [Gemmatimonadetes bacterium]|nr:nuclear transport factor 2 family protein [Gemmatimonadota bacterium]
MRKLVIILIAIFLTPALAAAQEPVRDRDRSEVREVVHSFHAALAAGDSAAAIRYLHEDVTIYESGRAETLADYRSGHLRSDVAFAQAVQRARTSEDVQLWQDIALYTSQTRTTGRYRGRDIDSRGVESMLLVRTTDGWRIRHIHWS